MTGPPRTDRDGHPDREARDAALLAQIRGGSEDAFETVLRTEWPSLLAYAAATLGDDDAAEDLAQEAFVRLWQRRRRWRGDGSARAILFRIVRNLALNERRRSTVRRRWNLHRRAGPPPSGTATPAQMLEARELEDAASRAIQALPERRREVFVLVRFHHLSYRETADVMDISPRTVANQMSAAIDDLGRDLAPWLDQSRRRLRVERGGG